MNKENNHNAKWYQISVIVPLAYQENIETFFWEHGAVSLTEESGDGSEIFDRFSAQQEVWKIVKLTALFENNTQLSGIYEALSAQFKDIVSNASEQTLEDQNWHERWLAQFQPVKISDNLWVCPTWVSPPNPSGINIFIDPGMAFGTGTHETTKGCLLALSLLDLKDRQVIDYGCGSGILSIGASLLGTEKVIANDIDPKAVEVSIENALLNNVADKINFMQTADFESYADAASLKADVVIANILSETLLELKEVICSRLKDDGILILSGILEHQAEKIKQGYTNCMKSKPVCWLQKSDNQWVTLMACQDSKKLSDIHF